MSLEDQTEAILHDLHQYVSFYLGKEAYGVSIQTIQEIIRYEKPTRVPQSSADLEGVLNLRGKVIPVIDLRKKFMLPDQDHDMHTRIIVVVNNQKTTGMIVDGVSEVLTLEADQIDPPPPLGTNINSEYIEGMGKFNDSLIILLDIAKLLLDTDIS